MFVLRLALVGYGRGQGGYSLGWGWVEHLSRVEILRTVTITGGDAAGRVGTAWKVPKRDLILGLQVMFETGEVEIAGGFRRRRSL